MPADAQGSEAAAEQPLHDDEERLRIDGIAMVRLLGPQDRLLTTIQREHPGVEVHVRGNEITIRGEADDRLRVRRLIEELLELVRAGQDPTPTEVRSSARMLEADPNAKPSELLGHCLLYTSPSPRDLSTSRMPSSA